MARKKKLERKKHPGASPGTLVHVGEKKAEEIRIRVTEYDDQILEERIVENIADLPVPKETTAKTWINVDGLHDTSVIEAMGRLFDLHALILEDILNTQQRPKMETYENCIFIVLKMLSLNEGGQQILSEQVSLVLRSGYVLSFQEAAGDVFEPVRQRIRSRTVRICRMGSDYLLYALVDAIVDHYFVVLEKVEGKLEVLEDEVFENPTVSTLAAIQQLKVELLHIRKAVWPLREAISALLRVEDELISERTQIYLKDVYDHTIQVIDTLESFRDTVAGLLDVYLSSVSNRMNEVMKVLTIIATIFIPLTFIAGIYGMNFEYMPELHLRWSYPAVWVVMLVVALLMILQFRRKGWF